MTCSECGGDLDQEGYCASLCQLDVLDEEDEEAEAEAAHERFWNRMSR